MAVRCGWVRHESIIRVCFCGGDKTGFGRKIFRGLVEKHVSLDLLIGTQICHDSGRGHTGSGFGGGGGTYTFVPRSRASRLVDMSPG